MTAAKDQTYALFNLTQKQLSHTLMPVGDYTKDEIRAIAEDIGLMVAHKKDSQEICFIPDNDYAGFIDRECGEMVPPPGNILCRWTESFRAAQGNYTLYDRTAQRTRDCVWISGVCDRDTPGDK